MAALPCVTRAPERCSCLVKTGSRSRPKPSCRHSPGSSCYEKFPSLGHNATHKLQLAVATCHRVPATCPTYRLSFFPLILPSLHYYHCNYLPTEFTCRSERELFLARHLGKTTPYLVFRSQSITRLHSGRTYRSALSGMLFK